MWSPRSPDLSPCGIYLLVHLKWVFYYPLLKTLNDFDSNVDREVKKMSNYVLEFVFFLFGKKVKFDY